MVKCLSLTWMKPYGFGPKKQAKKPVKAPIKH